MNDIKQVIVIRRDLKMRRGEEISVCSHASMEFLKKTFLRKGFLDAEAVPTSFGIRHCIYLLTKQAKWLKGIHKKVCVTVNSEEELLKIYEEAKSAGLEVNMVKDLGLTEFEEPTNMCLAIGPDYSEKIDKITGKLPLY